MYMFLIFIRTPTWSTDLRIG